MLRDIFSKQPSKELASKIISEYEARISLADSVDELDKIGAPPEVKAAIGRLFNSSFYGDITEEFKDSNLVNEFLNSQIKKNVSIDGTNKKNVTSINMMNPMDLSSYEQAGSQLRRLLPSPWLLHGFLCDAYWAAALSRRTLWKEVDRDGFILVSESKTSKKRIKECYQILESMNMKYKRNKMRDNLACFGNSLQRKVRNSKNGLLDIELMVVSKMAPIFDRFNDEIIGYYYYINNPDNRIIPASELDHLYTFSATSNVLAQPTLNSLVVLIEAALASQVYQNTVMQKGGLLRGLFVMKELSNGKEIINDKTYIELAETMTKYIEKRFGGIRGSGQLGFAPFVDKFIDLNHIGEMDGAWLNLNKDVALRTCSMFGVPPERIGLERGSQYKNQAEVFDSISLNFDNELYWTVGIVDDYINTLLEEIGYGDVKVAINGEFSSISLAAGDLLLKISQAAAEAITVDEWRIKVMKWSPHPDPKIGASYVGELKSTTEVAKALSTELRHYKVGDKEFVKHHPSEIVFY